MSKLETDVSIILTPLIQGDQSNLSATDMLTIARWFAMKVMVIDGDLAPRNMVTRAECQAFYHDRQPPAGLQILIAPIGQTQLGNSYERTAARVSRKSDVKTPDEGLNIGTIYFTAGHLLLFAFYFREGHMQVKDDLGNYADRLIRIWPANTGSIKWPIERRLNDEEAAAIEKTLLNFAVNVPSTFRPPNKNTIRLQRVAPISGAKEVRFTPTGAFRGDEFTDLGCGGCPRILAEGVSLQSLRALFLRSHKPSKAPVVLICPECGTTNLFPIHGNSRRAKTG